MSRTGVVFGRWLLNTVIADSFTGHARIKTQLKSTVLASVSGELVYRTHFLLLTRVLHVLLNTSAKEAL